MKNLQFIIIIIVVSVSCFMFGYLVRSSGALAVEADLIHTTNERDLARDSVKLHKLERDATQNRLNIVTKQYNDFINKATNDMHNINQGLRKTILQLHQN